MRTHARALLPLVALSFAAAQTPAQPGPSKQQQIETHFRQAQEYVKTSRPGLAAAEYSAIIQLDPENVDANGNLGVVLFFQGQFAKAVPPLRAALQRKPTLWNIQALLGACEKRLGDTAAARLDLERAFAEVPDERLRVQTGMELIDIYYGEGSLEKAAGIVATLQQLRPADPDIQYTAHRIYTDLAGEAMLSIAMSAPNSARMHQIMAQEMARQGNSEAAVAHYREALKLAPQTPGIHFELAQILDLSPSETDQAEAAKEYKASLEENPLDAKAACRLGDIASAASDLKGALAYYKRALDTHPDDADANFGVGKTLLAMHEAEKARPLLERAAKLDPYNATVHFRLAAAYRELGRPEDARRELAEFQRVRDMKSKLKEIYREMRIQPAKPERSDPDLPK